MFFKNLGSFQSLFLQIFFSAQIFLFSSWTPVIWMLDVLILFQSLWGFFSFLFTLKLDISYLFVLKFMGLSVIPILLASSNDSFIFVLMFSFSKMPVFFFFNSFYFFAGNFSLSIHFKSAHSYFIEHGILRAFKSLSNFNSSFWC